MMALPVQVSAQNKEARVKAIRQAYNEAKKDVADNGKKGHPRMDVSVIRNDGEKESEDFIIDDERETHYYFKRIHKRMDTDLFDPCVYFLTESWSSLGHVSYHEMLFDPFTSQLMFSYMRVETHAGFVIESRYYYDEKGKLIEEKHKAGNEETTADGQSWSSSGEDQEMAKELIALFNLLMTHRSDEARGHKAETVANKAAQIKNIRSLYAQAKQKIDKDSKSEMPQNAQIEIHDQEDPDLPPRKDVVRFWFQRFEDDAQAKLYFVSSTCQLGDHHVYSEYLFDPKESHLLFCFSQQRQNSGAASQWRYYFDATGRCIEVKGQDAHYGPGFADKLTGYHYLELFTALFGAQ